MAINTAKQFALACLLVGTSSGALADYTSFLALSGSYTFTPGVCTVPGPCATTSPWLGTVTVVTDSAVNGSYTGDHLLAVTLVTDKQLGAGFSLLAPATGQWGFSVVLAGGEATSINGTYPDVSNSRLETYSFSGLQLAYDAGYGYHAGTAQGSATLTPIAPAPEPASYAMLLAGLAVLSFVSRRRIK